MFSAVGWARIPGGRGAVAGSLSAGAAAASSSSLRASSNRSMAARQSAICTRTIWSGSPWVF